MVDSKTPPPPPFLPPIDRIRKDLGKDQVWIQVVIFLTFLAYALILIFGRLRSRGNSFNKFLSTKLFIISTSLISYIPGLMDAPGQSNDLYIFWAAFMGYLAAACNEVSCFTLGDNEDRRKRLIVDFAVIWPLILTSLIKNLAASEIIVPLVIICWLVVLKLRERSRALMYATNSSDGFSQATEIISIYDELQKAEPRSSSDYNNFLVGIREARKMMPKQSEPRARIDFLESSFSSKLITLHKVLDSNETFLVSTNTGKELRNTCISFAMFSVLLANKIAGYDDVDAKIYSGAYNKIPDNSFALVEKELEFLYDYLFTNYFAIYDRGVWRKLGDITIVCVFFWLAMPLMVEYYSEDKNILYVEWLGVVLDNGFSRFVIVGIIVIESVHMYMFLTSKWAKVMYCSAYLRNQALGTSKSTKDNITQCLLKVACLIYRPSLSLLRIKALLPKRQIRQYSILDCYCVIPSEIWVKCWIGSYFELRRMGQGGDKSIEVTPKLRVSIINAINYCLSKYEGKITNGVSSLEENKVGQDIITDYIKMKKMSQTRIILIWHIATSLLEEDDTKKPQSSESIGDEFKARATTISKYCAYLVAFLPKMLPDHVYTTRCEFDATVKDIDNELLYNDEENPSGRLNNGASCSTLKQARKLMEKLRKQECPNYWKTLADFWTETLLFLALSDHADVIEAHANSLCVGGEFITHLWALVTHAGCSRKPATTGTDDCPTIIVV